MAKKPTQPGPADLPPEPEDTFPADVFEVPDGQDTDPPVPVDISDAEVISDADLFDFGEAETEPMQAVRAPVAPVPAAPPTPIVPPSEEDIFAWGEVEEGSSTSFVSKRPAADPGESSVLSLDMEATAPQSGWLDSAVKLTSAAADSGTSAVPLAGLPGTADDPSLSASGVNLHDPEAGPRDFDSGSSIFSRKAVDESSQVELDVPRQVPADSGVLEPVAWDSGVLDSVALDSGVLDPEATAMEAVALDSGSLWGETDSVDAAQLAALRDDDAQAIDWEISDEHALPQPTMQAPRPDLDADDELSSWLEAEAREPVSKPASKPLPISDTTGVGMSVTAQPAPKRPPPSPVPVPDLEAEDDDWAEPVLAEPKRPAPKPAAKPAGAKKGAAGWIGGGLAGLLVGAGGVFGLSQMGILPGGDSKSTTQQPGPGPSNPGAVNPGAPAALTPEQGIAALDRGDAATAKKAFEALPADKLTPATQASRGHARLLARVQELADSGAAVKPDDEDLTEAGSDLKAVLDKAGELKTPDEQAAAVRAALNLGLLKELTNDLPGAAKVYTDAAAAVPAGKREFETALKRLKLTAPAGNAGKTGQLTPRQVEGLLVAVAVLLQGDPVPAKADNEPGHLFWDAANAAASSDFATASKLIDQAKAAHEARRLKLVGRGTNPKSDPAEQIFLSTCDQLKELYTLKATLYGHPVAGPLAKSDGPAKALDKLADAQKFAQKADADRLEAIQKMLKAEMKQKEVAGELDDAKMLLISKTDDLKKAMTDLTAAEKVKTAREETLVGIVKVFKTAKLIPEDADLAAMLAKLPDIAKQAAGGGDTKKLTDMLTAAKKEFDISQANLKAATDDLAKAKTELTKAMKLADDKTTELVDARKKAKAHDDVLAGLVKELKTAKLIPEDADPAASLAKLPDAVKKAASAATSGDAVKAAEALLAAKKELETVQTSLKKAETDLTAAKKEAADALAVAKKETDDKLAALKVVDTVKADAAKALKAAQDDAAKAVKTAQDNADKAMKAAADADKAAKAALDAEKVAKTALEDAKNALALAKKEADDKVKAAVEKAVTDADAKLKVAETAATKANDAAKKAVDDRKAAEDKLAAATDKLATAEAEFARQLASIKAGGGIAGPVTSADVLAQEKAEAAYSAGLRHYFGGGYATAEKEFRTATTIADARYHYFLGLSLLAQGKDAAASFRAGNELERRNMPNSRDIGEALERVQGPARAELAKYRR